MHPFSLLLFSASFPVWNECSQLDPRFPFEIVLSLKERRVELSQQHLFFFFFYHYKSSGAACKRSSLVFFSSVDLPILELASLLLHFFFSSDLLKAVESSFK